MLNCVGKTTDNKIVIKSMFDNHGISPMKSKLVIPEDDSTKNLVIKAALNRYEDSLRQKE